MLTISQYKKNIYKVRERLKYFYKPYVSMIVVTNKRKYLNNIYANFLRSNYGNKELIIILNNNSLQVDDYYRKFEGIQNVTVLKKDEKITLGECLNFGVSMSKYDYVAKIDDDDYYSENYLIDLINVFEYTNAEVTGKGNHFVYFEEFNILTIHYLNVENQYTDYLRGSTFLAKKSIFNKVQFRHLSLDEDTQFIRDCKKNGIIMFAADRYNHVYMKHKDLNDHTWKIRSRDLLNQCKIVESTDNFEPYICI